MANDPYEILGVSKNAGDADIKAAYRKLAKKYHPDLNPGNKEADAKFREINAANDFLSDKRKRAAYDRGEIDAGGQPKQQHFYRDYAQGQQGARYYHFGGEGAKDINMDDLFGSFFRNMRRGEPAQQPQPSRYSIEIGFMEAALGSRKRVTMPDGRTLDIVIPEGIDDGQQLRLKGQGENGGDAYVEVHIRPHPQFSRKGQDIYTEMPIGFHESILGSKAEAPTIHGPVEITIPKGAGSGATLRLKGKGIKKGDQYVKLKIVMPAAIDAELEETIRRWAQKHAYNPRKQKESAP